LNPSNQTYADRRYARYKRDKARKPTLEQIEAMYPGMIRVDIPQGRNWNNKDFRETMDKAY
jgi:hypothetical protein